MAIDKNAFEQHLAKLKLEYTAQLPQKLDTIKADWEKLNTQWDNERLILLHRNIHSLIGTSGTFGFLELSKSARELETNIKPLLVDKTESINITEDTNSRVLAGIAKLFSLLQIIQGIDTSKEDEHILNKLAVTITEKNPQTTAIEKTLIYYVDDEIAGPSLLTQRLMGYGFKAKHFQTMTQLFSAINDIKPNLVILDLMMPDIKEAEIFTYAKKLSVYGIKTFILSGKDDFQSRLAAVRANTNAYLAKPADVTSLIALIRSTLNIGNEHIPKILIVDDQESAAGFYANVLNMAGMQATIETDPTKTIEHLKNNTPDLLILDLNMPEVSGDELAAVIRQQERYQAIPILFLSANAKPELKTSLLEIGSDDLLSKGMAPEELVCQVRSRVARAKSLSSMMYQDSLTGLLNHAQIQMAAERVFSHSKRKKIASSVVLIDIDTFKQVNDQFGHLAGDKVLKALAQLLQQRLRLTDYVGRFGGDEFMLVLPYTNINDASNLTNSLRKAFHSILFKEKDIDFTVTFSAGIAENIGMIDYIEQTKSADEALYRAKERGRNIICASLSGDH
jgi:diguanylate cyclase (GGDEF)-like protein